MESWELTPLLINVLVVVGAVFCITKYWIAVGHTIQLRIARDFIEN